MAVYTEIVNWASNKSPFIKDAIRRLLNKQELSNEDISEVKELLKKENGFDDVDISPVPVTEVDIPSTYDTNRQIKLCEIHSPHNIAALYDKTPLKFSCDEMTIIYGGNGSGKSSYSKILKKVCWSRDKNIVLKNNIYSNDTSQQSVKIKFTDGNNADEFEWNQNSDVNDKLNTIYIFDGKCADIYINKENSAEYKPAGIDVLERLITLFCHIADSFDKDLLLLNAVKPVLAEEYKTTEIFVWYQTLEKNQKDEICAKLSFSPEQENRKKQLENSLKDSNLAETNQNLNFKKNRYSSLQAKLNNIELLFSPDNLKSVNEIKLKYFSKEEANRLARDSFECDKEFSIGGQAWRILWNAAREYATNELHKGYPITSQGDDNYCVLCHQPLSPSAKDRLQKFDLFIQDKTNIELQNAMKKVSDKSDEYNNIPKVLIDEDLKTEIASSNQELTKIIEQYENSIGSAKTKIIEFLNSEEQEITLPKIDIISLSGLISKEIESIQSQIESNIETIRNREIVKKEFLELSALYNLSQKKDDILEYFKETKLRERIEICKNKINTTFISKKIGELLESNAISKQQDIFIKYLRRLNPVIAQKISLKKTKTTSGTTFQKCRFNSATITEKISDIFSEGEQKIVAIANFLSECTIDGMKNTIVLDDPINSLDLDYRESIAKILVELSTDRQVIVLTHDLYFLRQLKDFYKSSYSKECFVTCLNSHNDSSGIVSDDIPYLAKNVQERIDTIRSQLDNIKGINISQIAQKNIIINDLKDKMRQLIERTVEDVLINKTMERFSKNVQFKKGNLANIVVVEKSDIDYLLQLYGKYSEVIHDGSIETVPNLITENDIKTDISDYQNWKNGFNQKVKKWKEENNYN